MNKIKYLCILLVISIAGCKATLSSSNDYSGERKVLVKNNIIYVAIAKNYSTSKKEYTNSGMETSKGILKSLKKYSKKSFMGEKVETVEEALASASNLNAKYMIFPEITLIHDALYLICNETNTDRVELTINVYSVETKEIIKETYLVAEGCPLRINGIPVGSTNPTSHVEKSVKRWNVKVFE